MNIEEQILIMEAELEIVKCKPIYTNNAANEFNKNRRLIVEAEIELLKGKRKIYI